MPPSVQVLNSKDILPLILSSLKDALMKSVEPCDWQDAFASIIRVSRAFFDAGMPMLWHTMTSVVPAFKLLPWYAEGSEYRGIDVRRDCLEYASFV